MNKLVVLFITAIIALFLTACWGTPTETVNTETKPPNTNSGKTVADFANTSSEANNTVNNSASNASNDGIPEMFNNVQSNKSGHQIKSGEPGKDTPEMKAAENNKQTIPAPENSFISNEMNKQGTPVQTRKFNGNPMIDKVEILTLGEKQTKQLLYLRNGKVLEIANGAVENPMFASSSTLLKAVGIEIKTAEQPNSEKKQ